MYKQINFEYNKASFLKIFENNPKDYSSPCFIKTSYELNKDILLEEFYKKFDFIPLDRNSVELFQLTKRVNPHVNPRNNGLILFPIDGLIEYTFYSYQPDCVNGRPLLDPGTVLDETDLYFKIENSLIQKTIILKPTAINGLVTHSYRPLVSPCIALVLKIPSKYSWDKLIRYLNYESNYSA